MIDFLHGRARLSLDPKADYASVSPALMRVIEPSASLPIQPIILHIPTSMTRSVHPSSTSHTNSLFLPYAAQ